MGIERARVIIADGSLICGIVSLAFFVEAA